MKMSYARVDPQTVKDRKTTVETCHQKQEGVMLGKLQVGASCH